MAMGLQPWVYGNIRECKENGIGTYDNINIVGTPLVDAVRQYATVPDGKHAPGSWAGVLSWQ
jgi:hypothetical protein